jgi:GT2 family glycosyltransferase
VLDNPLGIVPSAMNIGIRAAQGEWIVRLDAHSEYPADYFVRCLDTSRHTSADNVGGAVISVALNEGVQGKIVSALTTHWFGVGNSAPRTKDREGWADTVPFGCYRREVFDRIGLYDERLVRNQDYELNRRLIKLGGRIWYNPAIRILYYNRSSLGGLFRQAFSTGQWNPWMWFVAPYSFAWRHAVPMAFIGALLCACLMFLVAPGLARVVLNLTLWPYAGLAIAASLQQSSRYGGRLCLLLPFSFFTYHVVYGLGGLWGLCLLLARRAPVQFASQARYDVDRAPLPNRTIL